MSKRVGRREVGGQNALHPTWTSTVKVFRESWVTYGPEFMQGFLWFSNSAFLLKHR